MENMGTSYKLRLGKTTFIVCVKQAESVTKPLETALFNLRKREALGDFTTAQKFNFDNLTKSS